MTTPTEDILHFNIGWIAGIIDGEGSIISYYSPANKYFHTRIYIVNSDEDILRKCVSILTRLGILVYINQKVATKKQRENSYKFTTPCYEIIISQKQMVKRLIPLILPYIVSYKKQKLIKIMEYLNKHSFNAGRKVLRLETKRLAPEDNLKRLDEAIVRAHKKL